MSKDMEEKNTPDFVFPPWIISSNFYALKDSRNTIVNALLEKQRLFQSIHSVKVHLIGSIQMPLLQEGVPSSPRGALV